MATVVSALEFGRKPSGPQQHARRTVLKPSPATFSTSAAIRAGVAAFSTSGEAQNHCA